MSAPRPVVTRRARPVLSGPTYKAPRYHSRIWGPLIFFLLLVLLVGLIGGGGGLYYVLHRAQGSSGRTIQFTVSNGDSVDSIAQRLQNEHLISSTLLFKVDARIQGLSGKLRSGIYQLRPNMSIDQMVATLGVYKPVYVAVTIPEGFRIEQIAVALKASNIDPASFLAEAHHPDPKYLGASILAGKPAKAGLEGYLFPNTYYFQPHSSGKLVARVMVEQLGKEFTPAMRARARADGFSVYQVLTLASIVEREARVPSERPIIASVYLNRLRIKMPLDADPTVQYAAGTKANWWPVLQQTARTIDPSSPYNTYTHNGLPPGPIANPGLASINAVLHPKPTHYLYFLAIPNGHGHHAFASTYPQQEANEAKYGYPVG